MFQAPLNRDESPTTEGEKESTLEPVSHPLNILVSRLHLVVPTPYIADLI